MSDEDFPIAENLISPTAALNDLEPADSSNRRLIEYDFERERMKSRTMGRAGKMMDARQKVRC